MLRTTRRLATGRLPFGVQRTSRAPCLRASRPPPCPPSSWATCLATATTARRGGSTTASAPGATPSGPARTLPCAPSRTGARWTPRGAATYGTTAREGCARRPRRTAPGPSRPTGFVPRTRGRGTRAVTTRATTGPPSAPTRGRVPPRTGSLWGRSMMLAATGAPPRTPAHSPSARSGPWAWRSPGTTRRAPRRLRSLSST
mmetsp:Transcript_37515/g.91176  ORF Transcript_37515/g.91176 Transcript_37515/m.91176 type:complete len:201 (+) Transcript_37515:3229-3831(+)